jgi:hypothetical protein
MEDDREFAQASFDVYANNLVFDKLLNFGGIVAGLYSVNGKRDLLAFRGTENIDDWAHDLFFKRAVIHDHPQLGKLHAGFASGMGEFYQNFLPLYDGSLRITGHSLGGARALILGALLTLSGREPARIITFGAPRPGFSRLADVLAPVKITQYRNGTGAMRSDGSSHDLVTDMPLHIPVVAPFVHPREPLIDLSAPPKAQDALGPFAWHRMSLYLDAIIKGG